MVSTHMNLYWDNKVWGVLEKTVLKYPDKFKPGFLAWLHERPALWDKLASVAQESSKLDDPYGFSIFHCSLLCLRSAYACYQYFTGSQYRCNGIPKSLFGLANGELPCNLGR